MASLIKTYDNQKLLGQTYTPDFVVKKVLDSAGYFGNHIPGKKILDPACGDGRFLTEIVKRIVAASPPESLRENLTCVYGWEIDPDAARLCIDNLNRVVEPLGIEATWNITVCDSIHNLQNDSLFASKKNLFDYVVGNPPYVRIQHLDEARRKFLKSNYTLCQSGSTDLYIAFFELSASLLSDGGICSIVTPNTFLYTETGKKLRQYFADNQNIVRLTNYGDSLLFPGVSTYSAVTTFGKQRRPRFIYEKFKRPHAVIEKTVDSDRLTSGIWNFLDDETIHKNGKYLGEIADIHVGITTLADKLYVFNLSKRKENTTEVISKSGETIELESAILKPIIKASTVKSTQQSIDEVVLFPYRKRDGRHVVIPEDELREVYPLAYAYLRSVRKELDKRDAGKPNTVAWYAFGRSQGLDTGFGAKILFSPMNIRPNFVWRPEEDATFYSGYCIKFDGDPELLLSQLNSERMRKHIESTGRDYRGGWKAYNKSNVSQFTVTL